MGEQFDRSSDGPAPRARGGGSALAAIAKTPVAGAVKTRLCPPCTAAEAAILARAALLDTLAAMLATPAERHVLVLDGAGGPWLEEAHVLAGSNATELEVIAQRGVGLAERLAHAFTDIDGATLIIGMDTPQVTPRLLGDALALLARPDTDAVIGGAPDGGYWAIGLERPDERVFAGVPMSTTDTAAIQRDRLRECGLRTAELCVVRDFDRFSDAAEIAASAPYTRFARAFAPVRDQQAALLR